MKSLYITDVGCLPIPVPATDLPDMSATEKGAVPATGTPSGKFLRDDATWQTVQGGTGSKESHITFVSLGVAQSI